MIDRFANIGVLGAALLVLPAGMASAAALSIVSIAGQVTADPQHLGYEPGYGEGLAGEPLPSAPTTTQSSTASAMSLAIMDELYWGPDMFDRSNSGSFDLSLSATAGPSAITGAWDVYASASGEASPEIWNAASYSVNFTVSEDTTATLDLLLGGTTGFATDRVAFEIAEVGAPIGFWNAAWFLPVAHSEASGRFTLNLFAGRSYVLRLDSSVRASQIASTYLGSGAFGRFSLSLDDPDPLPAVPLPAPAVLLGCGLGALGLVRRRKRQG